MKNTEILTSGTVSYSVYWPRYVERGTGMSDDQYNQKIKEFISNCKLVKGEFWENVRKEFLKKFEYQLELERIEKEAVKDPSLLKSSIFAEYCVDYTNILNGTDEELMAEWKKFVTKSSKNNADPQRIMKKFREEANKPDWVEYARRELLTYGWRSCINDHAHEGKFYQLDETAVDRAFRKLFVKIDEPEP